MIRILVAAITVTAPQMAKAQVLGPPITEAQCAAV